MSLPQRSVKAEHIDLGAVRTEHMQISGSAGMGFSSGSTTNTTDFFTVGTYDLHVPTPRVQFLVPHLLQVKHSVAGARVELHFTLYSQGGVAPSITAAYYRDVVMPTANEWVVLSGEGAAQLDLQHTTAGTKSLYAVIRNRTAGTLTWADGTGYDFMAHFMVGR